MLCGIRFSFSDRPKCNQPLLASGSKYMDDLVLSTAVGVVDKEEECEEEKKKEEKEKEEKRRRRKRTEEMAHLHHLLSFIYC